MVKCMICGKDYQNLSSHINFKHSMSKNEYLKKWPKAELVSKELSTRFSNRSKKMHEILKEKNYNEYMAIRNKTCLIMRQNKGDNFVHSEETKKQMSQSHLGKSNGGHSDETKKKLSVQKTGRPVNLSEVSKTLKTQRQKEKWQQRKEDTEVFRTYIEKLSKTRTEYVRKHGISLPKKGKKTNIEKRFISFLHTNSILYEYQYFLNGKYFDFYIPLMNLLVEVDGEYWHRFPQAIKNDLEKHVIAKEAGFKLLRLTHINWTPELLFESNYYNIQLHNYEIINARTKECQNYEISISNV